MSCAPTLTFRPCADSDALMVRAQSASDLKRKAGRRTEAATRLRGIIAQVKASRAKRILRFKTDKGRSGSHWWTIPDANCEVPAVWVRQWRNNGWIDWEYDGQRYWIAVLPDGVSACKEIAA